MLRLCKLIQNGVEFITRNTDGFDSVLDQLAEAGMKIKSDREQAWKDFAGWRVNYDRSLLVLCRLVMAPYAVWSSDRARI